MPCGRLTLGPVQTASFPLACRLERGLRAVPAGPASRRHSGPAVASAAATALRPPSSCKALSSQVPAKGTQRAGSLLQGGRLTPAPSIFLNSVAVSASPSCCKRTQRGGPHLREQNFFGSTRRGPGARDPPELSFSPAPRLVPLSRGCREECTEATTRPQPLL